MENNPHAPFIKGDFLKSPLTKGDSGGCHSPLERKRGVLPEQPKTLKFLYIKLGPWQLTNAHFPSLDGRDQGRVIHVFLSPPPDLPHPFDIAQGRQGGGTICLKFPHAESKMTVTGKVTVILSPAFSL